MNLGQFCWFTVQMFPRIYIYYEKTLLGVGGPGLHCQSVAADLLLSDHSEQDYEHLSKLSAAAAQQCWKQMAGCLLTNGFVNMTQRNLCCWLWRETFLSWLWSRRKQNTFSADGHLLQVTHWPGASYKPTSEDLNYPFKHKLLQVEEKLRWEREAVGRRWVSADGWRSTESHRD